MMPISFPDGPIPEEGWDRPKRLQLRPGEGVGITLFESMESFSFTTPMGKCSLLLVALPSELKKWGFECVKIGEEIEVSPVYSPYYELTLKQKAALEAEIKSGMEALTRSLSALRSVEEELTRYKEYMDYYAMMERGKRLIEERKEKEGRELVYKADKTLRHVFIDRVDVHTGPRVALKEIVVKWPTIISDFLKLEDEDVEPERVAKKLKVSVAEATILATKNKIYLEWRDNLFKPKVLEDYKRLRTQVEGWRKTWEEYRKWLKPLISRYKSIRVAAAPHRLERIPVWRPGAVPIAMERVQFWAWKPFLPAERYRPAREVLETIPAREAGFTANEIEQLRGVLKDWDGRVRSLPVEPSIDGVVRRFIKDIEGVYGVKLDAKDLYDARHEFASKYYHMRRGRARWVDSPYFIVIELPLLRAALRFPDGKEGEDLSTEGTIRLRLETQNLVLLRYLELVARDKQIEEEMRLMLGEAGVKQEEIKALERIMQEEYPEVFARPAPKPRLLDELHARIERKLDKWAEFKFRWESKLAELKSKVGEFLRSVGINVPALRVIGPYEFYIPRIYELFLAYPDKAYFDLIAYLKTSFEVP